MKKVYANNISKLNSYHILSEFWERKNLSKFERKENWCNMADNINTQYKNVYNYLWKFFFEKILIISDEYQTRVN